MANRVLLGQFASNDHRLRISKPGFNVLDPALTREQIHFDSTWSASPSVLVQGSFAITSDFYAGFEKWFITLATWPDLGYVPCLLTYRVDPADGINAAPGRVFWLYCTRTALRATRLEATNTIHYVVLRHPEGGILG
jgi:hypothetical protein